MNGELDKPPFGHLKPLDRVIIHFPNPPENQPPYQCVAVRKVGTVSFETWDTRIYCLRTGREFCPLNNAQALLYSPANVALMEQENAKWDNDGARRKLARNISEYPFHNMPLYLLQEIERIINTDLAIKHGS